MRDVDAAKRTPGQEPDSDDASDGPLTLGQYARDWLQRAALSIDPLTVVGYERSFRLHLQPLVDRPLEELRRPDIRALLLELRVRNPAPSGGIAKTAYVALCACLRAAIDEGVLTHNPAHGSLRKIILPRRELLRCDTKAMPLTHLDVFLRAVEALPPDEKSQLLADVLVTLTACGARIGEVLALRPEDIDEDRCRLHIALSWSTSRLGLPKGRLPRWVNVPESLIRRLVLRREKNGRAPNGLERPWLFPSVRGGKVRGTISRLLRMPVPAEWPVSHDHIDKGMHELCAAAGLPKRYTPHCLRHTWATQALERTNDLLYVARQLGHSSIITTADLYGAAADPARPEVVDHFAHLIDRERLLATGRRDAGRSFDEPRQTNSSVRKGYPATLGADDEAMVTRRPRPRANGGFAGTGRSVFRVAGRADE